MTTEALKPEPATKSTNQQKLEKLYQDRNIAAANVGYSDFNIEEMQAKRGQEYVKIRNLSIDIEKLEAKIKADSAPPEPKIEEVLMSQPGATMTGVDNAVLT